jgi:hypothetical protein
MRCFLTISVAAGLMLSASVGRLSVAHAQPNDVRTATTPEGQVPVAPAVVAAPATVVEQTTVAPAAVVAAPPAEVALAGQVLRTKQVDLRGTNEKVLVALVDAGDGQRQIVDLGPTLNYKAAPVYTGDQIAVRGPRVALGKANVLVATEATIGSNAVAIKRVAPAAATTTVVTAAAAPSGYVVGEKIFKVDGRIEHLRRARLLGSNVEHIIAEVVTRNARAVVVDLGPPAAIWKADIKQGEWITIQGQQMDVNNRPVFLALEINKNGVPYLIDRQLVREAPATPVVEEQVLP